MTTVAYRNIRWVHVPKYIQEDSMRCWAATIQSVLHSFGVKISQDRIFEMAKELKHGTCSFQRCNQPDNAYTIQKVLNSYLNIQWDVFDCNENKNQTNLLMLTMLKREVPFILNFHVDQNKIGHSVVVCGGKLHIVQYPYSTNAEYLIFMDPANGSYSSLPYNYLLSKSTHIVYAPSLLNSIHSVNGFYRNQLPF